MSQDDSQALHVFEPTSTTGQKRSAFAELMSPKPKQAKPTPQAQTLKPSTSPALSGLLPYITKPDTFPPGTIIRQTEHTILIRDLFPKSLVHLLLLPRNPDFYNLTPFEAFNPTDDKHTAFLELMKDEAASAAKLAASELSRLISQHSERDRARREAMDAEPPPDILPIGRDFLSEIKVGIHAQPSMKTLHVHIISKDMYSERLKHKKHYNSFNTEFFVELDDFPLMEGDNLMDSEEQDALLKADMKCWRCGRSCGNKFKQLKEHLKGEYEEWKKL